mgnify:CR=1 FL=1
MRIAVVTSEFPPINAAASARIGPWVHELDCRGHQINVFSSRGSKQMGRTKHYESRLAVPSNRVGIIRRFYQEMRLACDLGSRITKINDVLDGVVITSPPFFLATYIAKVSKKKKIPYLFDVRDRYPAVLFDLNIVSKKNPLGKILQWREKSCYEKSAMVSTVTKGLNAEMDSFKVLNKHVPNGYDGEFFDPTLFKKKDKIFRVVYHGRFSRLHDINSLRQISLKVKALDPEIEFIIIGPIPDSERLKDWGNVNFTGEKDRIEIPSLLSDASVGISLMQRMNSTKVAMPAKVYEYLGMGLPLLVAPDGELNDFVKLNQIGLAFEKTDHVIIAESIVMLKSNRLRYANLQEQVYSIRSKFDRRLQSIEFVDLIESTFAPFKKKFS